MKSIIFCLSIISFLGCSGNQPPKHKVGIVKISCQTSQGDQGLLLHYKNLAIDNQGNVTIIIKDINKPETEKQYKAVLNKDKIVKLHEVINKHNFFNISIPAPAGGHSSHQLEPMISITVLLANGKSKTISKWYSQEHPGFDAIYNELLAIEKAAN